MNQTRKPPSRGNCLPHSRPPRSWEDVYRQQWRWDRVARGTHSTTNCVSGCAWGLYVKDNLVWREEQKAPYAASMPRLPDFNPGGCQKRACGASVMYSPSRVRYPLRRVGERGEGRWQRISWNQALAAIAKAMVDAIESEGPASVVCELGPNIGAGPNSAAPLRFFRLLGSPIIDPAAQIGDLIGGATITFGNGTPCGSSDDWHRSLYLVLWAFNPSVTRIPDAHFLNDARYRGTQVVVVAPDFNASATHADLWLNPRPGTDAALALGAAQVIIEEGLYNAAYVAEQTDLPLLVRTDTGRFVREGDLLNGGSDAAFYVWDSAQCQPLPAPGSGASKRLDNSGLTVDLAFSGTIPIHGQPVPVRTVFSLLRERLDATHPPEQVAEITGIAAATILQLARGFAKAPAALILAEFGRCKFLHGDPSAPRPAADYLREAVEKNWFPVSPPPGRPPQVMVSVLGNILRHTRNNKRLLETLWPKMKLVVDVTFRMSETARWAEILLPAAIWYEKLDIKYLTSYVPYVHLGDRAVPPLGEAEPEWEIFALLAEAVAREARRRNLAPYADIANVERDARRLDDAFTDGGRFGPKDEEKAMRFILEYSSPVKGVTLEDLRRDGATRFCSTGADGAVGYFSDYSPNEPLVPHKWFVQKKQRWPTLTGRQQFYIDHPWFLECDEALPTHKPPPAAGGNYPLVLSGGHTRWSIHSQWRDQPDMLRLQRCEPVVYLSETDAAQPRIKDHDLVRVRNDLGAFVLRAKIAGYVRPGQVLVYHAWEPYQFRGGRSDHAIIPSPFKPTSLVGDYGHLHWLQGHWEPNQVDRDTRVEVERA